MDELSIELDPGDSYENSVLNPSSALIKAFSNNNVAEVDHIIQTNNNNLGLYNAVKNCIMQCAKGRKPNGDILLALMKYPHVPFTSSVGSQDFLGNACSSCDLETFQAMLRVGWDPCTIHQYVGDALTDAVMRDNLSLVCWLLDHGAEYDANEAWQPFSVLARAARFASPAVIERLLAAGAPIKDSRALELAVYDGRIDSVECLVDHGGDINEIAAETSTWIKFNREAERHGYGAALHAAAKRGHIKAVKFLIDRGANVELRDSQGRTAFELAMMEKHLDIVDLLKSHPQY